MKRKVQLSMKRKEFEFLLEKKSTVKHEKIQVSDVKNVQFWHKKNVQLNLKRKVKVQM